jgi:PAS domain S-box-containing protein
MTGRLFLYIALFSCPFWAWSQPATPASPTNYRAFSRISDFIAAARTNLPLPVQLRGTVTYSYRQSSFNMQDESAGLFVSSATNLFLQVGDVVEVKGLSVPGGFSPVLRQENVRKIGENAATLPIATTAKEILAGKYDMSLVRLQGTLLEIMPGPDRTIYLRMLDGTIPFYAELDREGKPDEWNKFVTHSILSVTGVCSIGGSPGSARQFRIVLRSSNDVTVVKAPPWWTSERTMRVVIILGLLILGGLIWVAALNHQVRQQTRELRTRFEREAELEDQYHELFENAEELIFTLDTEGRFLSLNKATERALGVVRYEALGRNFADYVLPEQREGFVKFIENSVRQVPAGLGEFVVTGPQKERSSLELSCHRMNRPRAAVELQVIARDITERKRAEAEIHRLTNVLENRVAERTEQLEIANKELEAFSYSVSHDLRAPLRAIDGFARILVEENLKDADADTRHLLEGINKNAARMARLIDDLLQFSRLTRTSLVTGRISLDEMFNTIFREQRALNPDRKIEFTTQKLPVVQGDEAMLRQVAENLVSNALKYSRTRELARIEVGARAEKGEDVVFVRDNGVGFDMRYAGKLFQVFQRLHSDSEFEGTGVGLAIVQRVIHRHGGRVWAEAEPEKGATFYFSIPHVPPTGNAAAKSKSGFAV